MSAESPGNGVSNIQPATNNSNGQNLSGNLYACYKLKCAKVSNPVNINDTRFGNRSGTIAATNLLCAPASVSNPAT